MGMFDITQTAKVTKGADGKLTGISNINTDAGMISGAITKVTSLFNGGEDIVIGAGNTLGTVLVGAGTSIVLRKAGRALNFDPFFGLMD